MPLAIPTYEQYPTPSKPPRRSSGGSRPSGGGSSSPTPPAMPPRVPTSAPSRGVGGGGGGGGSGSTPPPQEPRFPTRPDDYGKGLPGQIDGMTYDQLMALDFTGMKPSYVPPERQAEHDYNRQVMEQRDSILDQYNSWSNSQSDALLTQYNLGVNNMTALYDLNKGILEQGRNTDLGLLDERRYRDVDLAREGLAGKQQDLSQYYDILAKRMGIRRDMFTTDRDYFNALNNLLGRERGLAYDKFQTNDQYLAGVGQDNQKQYGFAARDYRTDIAGSRLQRDTSRRAATSDSAARGAFGGAGFRDNISDIMSQYGLNMETANLGLDRANQQIGEADRQIGNQRANLGFGYQGQVIGFDRDAAGLTRSAAQNYHGYRDDLQGFRKQRVDLDSQGRDLAQTGKALDSLAREYGIKRSDLENQFNNAVTRLGLDSKQAREQLEQMLNSGNAELVRRGLDFMNQMMVFQQ